jgi:hypothetical protein
VHDARTIKSVGSLDNETRSRDLSVVHDTASRITGEATQIDFKVPPFRTNPDGRYGFSQQAGNRALDRSPNGGYVFRRRGWQSSPFV